MKLLQLLEADSGAPETKLIELLKEFSKPSHPVIEALKGLLDKGHLQEHSLTISVLEKAGRSTNPSVALSLVKPIIKLLSDMDKLKVDSYLPAAFLTAWLVKVLEVALQNDKLAARLLKKAEAADLQRFIESASDLISKKDQRVDLLLLLKKAARSRKDKTFDKQNDTYIFIGRQAFVEVPKGSGNYQKTLEIEKLMKVDPFSPQTHKMAAMLQLRTKFQGEGSQVYKVSLPKGAVDDDDIDHPPHWLVKLIDDHKQVVR
jgi:hypothetical protein